MKVTIKELKEMEVCSSGIEFFEKHCLDCKSLKEQVDIFLKHQIYDDLCWYIVKKLHQKSKKHLLRLMLFFLEDVKKYAKNIDIIDNCIVAIKKVIKYDSKKNRDNARVAAVAAASAAITADTYDANYASNAAAYDAAYAAADSSAISASAYAALAAAIDSNAYATADSADDATYRRYIYKAIEILEER